MSDRQLRSDLIRLASRSTPEVKAAILPLLSKKAAKTPKTAGGFVASSSWEEACEVFCKAAGIEFACDTVVAQSQQAVPVPSNLRSLFKSLRITTDPDTRGATRVYWKYDHPQGGSNGLFIGTVFDEESRGGPGYRIED
jgi:hypothetical protein